MPLLTSQRVNLASLGLHVLCAPHRRQGVTTLWDVLESSGLRSECFHDRDLTPPTPPGLAVPSTEWPNSGTTGKVAGRTPVLQMSAEP